MRGRAPPEALGRKPTTHSSLAPDISTYPGRRALGGGLAILPRPPYCGRGIETCDRCVSSQAVRSRRWSRPGRPHVTAGAAARRHSSVLPNGVTIVTRQRPGSQVLAIDVAVRAGARYETASTASAARVPRKRADARHRALALA